MLDLFAADHSDAAKKEAKNLGTTLAVITGNLILSIQPSDICLFKLSKFSV